MRLLSAAFVLLFPALSWGWEHKTDHSGNPVRFGQKEITFHLPHHIPSDLDAKEVEDALRKSLESWAEVTGLVLKIERGPANARAGYSKQGENRNDVLFVERDWPYEENAVGVTVVTVDPRSHEIIDADVLLNADLRRFKRLPEDAKPGAHIYDDLQNTLTHELGHALGLAHTEEPAAAMFGDTRRGEVSKRSLSEDDIDGIRALYLSAAAGRQESSMAGCSAAGPGLAPWFALALAPLVLRRRRT